ncbi:hypothetical protein EON82_10125 [bacterium]|nr:MAG: hypothetical protein EON82_10125 [bacterium]
MYVPNYVPEPLEVPANVTLDPYPVRLAFIRKVTLLHSASLCLVAGLAWLPFPPVPLLAALVLLGVMLLLLDGIRVMFRGKAMEPQLSVGAGMVLAGVVALTVRMAVLQGIPVWAVLVGPAFALAYTLLCGRDYSFVGCGLLSLIGSSVVLAGMIVETGMGVRVAAWALGLNTAYLVYFVYDLASLMSRRRRGEELAAVVDLYRDVFNIFGYIPRVISHWSRHRIWQDVKFR